VSNNSSKTAVILQSSYIPWKGYFDLINYADDFIIYDIVQYTKNDWRNRNKIKTPDGTKWLTIPIRQMRLHQTIYETKISNSNWNIKHWKTIAQNYAKAPYFKLYKDEFEELYLSLEEVHLSEINLILIKFICRLLDIKTRFHHSRDFSLESGKTERLVDICNIVGAKKYLSGPAAKSYIKPEVFKASGIELIWMNYSNYPEYSQLFPPFCHGVSILDLFFNTGPEAKKFMKSFNK
jgi:hypothetical protein